MTTFFLDLVLTRVSCFFSLPRDMLTTLYLPRRRAKQSNAALIVPRSDPLFLLITTIPSHPADPVSVSHLSSTDSANTFHADIYRGLACAPYLGLFMQTALLLYIHTTQESLPLHWSRSLSRERCV